MTELSLQTSFMKWKPDYDSAASEYAKAGESSTWCSSYLNSWGMISDDLLFSSPAVAFKNAKQLDQAKEAYLLEAEAHTNHRSYPLIIDY